MKKIVLLCLAFILTISSTSCSLFKNDGVSVENGIPLVYTEVDDGYEVSAMSSVYQIALGMYGIELSELIIPSEYNGKPVVSIADDAFNSFVHLKTVEIPETVKRIGERAFSLCSKLESITIPDSVVSVGASAFIDCVLLQSVTISKQLKVIEDYTFAGCLLLNEVNFQEESQLTHIGYGAFGMCLALKNINIPANVEVIGAEAFLQCALLERVECENITNLKSIGYGAFEGAPLYLYERDGWRYLGSTDYPWYALIESKDENATSCNIKNDTKVICNSAFSHNTDITISENNQNFKLIDGSLYNYDGTKLIKYMRQNDETTFEVPNCVIDISDGAFRMCDFLTDVVLPNSLVTIGDIAFQGCKSLVNINIPNGVTTFGILILTKDLHP